MSASEYLDYLIDTARQHEAGDMSFGVQPSELVTLRALLNSEKALQLAVNKNGNPA